MVKKQAPKNASAATTKTPSIVTTTDLRSKDMRELLDVLKATQLDLANARRSLAAGELINPNVLSMYRKTIARIQTVIVEKVHSDHGKEDA